MKIKDRLVSARGSRALLLALALTGIWIVLAISSLVRGNPELSLDGLVKLLAYGEGERMDRIIVLDVRLPRLLLAAIAGMMLAMAGALLQDVLRNSLAGPELLGVSAGASAVMAVLVVFRLPFAFAAYPWLALGGALLGGGIVLFASRSSREPVRLVLTGVALSALFSSLVVLVISMGTANDIMLLMYFLLGSLANRTWEHVHIIAPWAAVCIPLALLFAKPLNVLKLGDEAAEGIGVRVLKTRVLVLTLAVALVASIVAICGPIAFVALLAPHLARQLAGTQDARMVLPLAAIVGAVLLTFADFLARIVLQPQEIPVGVWTTLLGGPALLMLLVRGPGGLRQ